MSRRRRSDLEIVFGVLAAIVTAIVREPALLLLPCLLVTWGGLAAIGHDPVGGTLVVLASLGVAVALGSWRLRHYQQVRADQAAAAQLYAVRATEIASYQAMNATQFEQALGYLCARDGCTTVQVVGRSGDLGADVVAVTPDGLRLVIQAKRYRPGNRVSGPDLQRFGGTCFTIHGAGIAVVVTTSDFTSQARAYAQRAGIRLFDEHALAAWASRTGPAPWM
ncbi:restriction endonuclease [Actinospica durhamensis]|uniref:Restriction endonuclease n=1 Tax=Actinospica durhamensis TaxID=1508375 RepID=A0A941EMF2_9ACTN|nr:restriction endonuclease [Actinospica durhamensis]MBR7833058.1 restriction endonuclease [Actinospica durhamensis]